MIRSRRVVLQSLAGALAVGPAVLRAEDETADAVPLGVQSRALRFPRDHGAHPETRIEWWYLTGWLAPGDGAEAVDAGASSPGAPPPYGFQVTFFRSRTGVPADHPSRFAASQLLFAHVALSDVAGRRLRHDQRVARAGFGLAEASQRDTDVHLGRWRLQREGEVGTASRYRTEIASDDARFALALVAATTQPRLLQGDAGFSRKGPRPDQASHYYSQPQLDVTGTLTLDGRPQPVRGRAWLDHEWSDELMDASAVGWDWTGINLADGSALTAFRLRRADGSTLYTGGSWRPAGGAARSFGPDEVRFTPGRRWRSPATQAEYPVDWTLDTPAGRHRLVARFDAQELDSRASTGAVYWEGLSDLQTDDGRVIGRGYLEMTGYADRLRLR